MGNFDAIVTTYFSRNILKKAGIHADRFALGWASAAEAPLFVKLITEFTNRIKALGRLGEVEGLSSERLKKNLSAAKFVSTNIKLRTRFAKLTIDLREGNDYSPQLIETKISEKLDEAISKEMEKRIKASI